MILNFILFIIITIITWAFGCYIIQEYEMFYDFADRFKRPINKIIKIFFNLPYVGFIVGMLTISGLFIGCLIGIVISYPIIKIYEIIKKEN
jgi:hypothetical protein